MSAPAILAAKAEALTARADLTATLSELQARVAPRHLAQSALDSVRERGEELANTVRERGEELAEQGQHFAKRQPGTVAGFAAALGLLILRKPISRGVRKLFSRKPKPVADEDHVTSLELLLAQKPKQEIQP